jgi:alkylated DNA repair dioxygenase AlkB
LLQLKSKIEEVSEAAFNSVLLNKYRDGNDTVGWHSDDERELGRNPIIASLSLGIARDFILRHKYKPNELKIQLRHGSLLIMRGHTQEYWKHALPRRKRITEPRINLTFRAICA